MQTQALKLNYKRTFFVGLAFMSISAFWQMYDNIVPLILKYTFSVDDTLIGVVMAMDNVLALFMLPLFGRLSDKTRTRIGRRMPYILIGTAVAVACLVLLPVAEASHSLPLFFVGLGLVLIAMATYRSPAVALMPDVTPKPLRSQGNAVINLMGAVGGMLMLVAMQVLLPKAVAGESYHPNYAPIFGTLGVVMALCVAGGMAACPVIAVPTSVGYGASFGGVAALLAMLNSCASGVSVVNIDNGFGAGYQAHMIERAGSRHGEGEPDVNTLRWNLAENATRNQLLGDTLLQLPPDTRQRLEAAADAAGVPDRHHHDIGEVLATIDGLAVSPAVRDHMRAIYTILAEAEAAAHGCAVEQTHFHEVGDGSRIRNTLLVCLAVEATGVKRIVATVAQTGQGEVECAHGTLSIPAPATSAIIARGIPVSERTLPGERMTPTSAAMILHFVDEFE